MNSEELLINDFQSIFTYDECLIEKYNGYQAGGRLASYKNNKILLTTGDFQNFSPAQDKESIFGKIISIDLDTKNYELVSIGHRNPQGLLYDRSLDLILSTEHGQKGGDEVNKIIDNESNNPSNYGWPISSYSDYYGYEGYEIRKIAPLKKSHKDFGFIEPLIYFTPALGISKIIDSNNFSLYNQQNVYLISSMAKKKIVFVKFDNNFVNATQINELIIGERIRDIIKFKNDMYLLFLENTPAIGILSLK